MAAMPGNQEEPESLVRVPIEDEDDSESESKIGDFHEASQKELDESHLMFLIMRGPVIEILHAALKAMLLKMYPPLDADRATLEQLRVADGNFPVEKIMSDFKETIDDSKPKNEIEDTPYLREQRYEEITLVSKDVSFYAKILRVFFKKEYLEEKRYPSLKKIVELRNELNHYTKDDAKTFLDPVEGILSKAVLEIQNELECPASAGFLCDLQDTLKFHNIQRFTNSYVLSMAKMFPDRFELLRAAKHETASLNSLCSKLNLLTLMEQLQACESIRGVTVTDVFVSPLMTFRDQTWDDLPKVFSDEANGACTGLRAVLLSGSSGSGKSTLAYRLVQSWLDDSSPHLAQFQIVFLINLHHARHSDIFSHLKEVMPRTMEKLSPDNFIETFIDLKVLLVIDGFDARYPRRLTLLRNICDTFKRSSALIITSNDSLYAAQDCFVSVADHTRPVVKVIGFDSERCENFVTNILAFVKEEVERTALRKKFELVMSHRQSLFPCQQESILVVSLSILILLLDLNVSKEWFESTPKICHIFFSALRKISESTLNVADCPPKTPLDDDLFLMLGEICFKKLQSDGRLEIFQEDLNGVGLKDASLILCLLKNEINNGTDAAYSFCSASFMHYLAAFFLSNEVRIKDQSLHTYFKHNNRLFELLPYLVRDSCLLEIYCAEIFDIALNVMKRSCSEDVYTFWHDILSQVSLNSNRVLHESVTNVFQGSEWNLKKESLVPAAGLLKFCSPGVTHKLKINLTGSDTSNNEILMQHLRECLRENYCNGETIICLSLDLEMPIEESSCAWFDVLEEPFLRLVDFTGHVDAASVLMLRECRHLSSITLRLSSLDSFNQFTKCYEVFEFLEVVKLHICFLDSISEMFSEQVKRLCNKEEASEPSAFELIFDGLESRLLTVFFSLLLNILPSNQEFFKITLRNTSLDFSDAHKLLNTKFFVDGCLDVKSTCSLSTDEKDRLKAETFRDEDGLHQWPLFQFRWNGRCW